MYNELPEITMADPDTVKVNPEQPWHNKVPWEKRFLNTTTDLPTYIVEGLKHNYPLSEDELSLVEEYQRKGNTVYPSIEKSLERIDEELARLHEAKTRLKNDRVDLVLKTSLACKIVKSPFRRIPVDVHKLILSYCVEHVPYPGIHIAPMILCRISSTWRRLALSMPELWTDICFPFHDEAFSFSTRTLKRFLSVFAARSRDLLMNVHLNLQLDDEAPRSLTDSDDSSDSGCYKDAPFLQFHKMDKYLPLWSKNNKIQSLHIYSPCVRYTMEILDRPASSFQNLEYLTVFGCNTDTLCDLIDHDSTAEPKVEDHLVALLQAPKLQAMSIGGQTNLPPVTRIGPLLLTYVLSSIFSTEEWIGLLANRFLVLQKGYFFFPHPIPTAPPMPLTDIITLEELALDFAFDFDLPVNASHYHCLIPVCFFRFPNLRRFRIALRNILPSKDTDPASKPTCHVTQQDLYLAFSSLRAVREFALTFTWDLPIDNGFALLQSFSNLTSLTLVLSNADYHPYMYFLSFGGNLPYLEHLRLEFRRRFMQHPPFNNLAADVFVGLVAARWDVMLTLLTDHVTLRQISLMIFDYESPTPTRNIDEIILDMKHRLRWYTDNGFILSINDFPNSLSFSPPKANDTDWWDSDPPT